MSELEPRQESSRKLSAVQPCLWACNCGPIIDSADIVIFGLVGVVIGFLTGAAATFGWFAACDWKRTKASSVHLIAGVCCTSPGGIASLLGTLAGFSRSA